MKKDEKRLEVAKLLLDEWKHRDTSYNKHTFTYFSGLLLFSVIPYIKFGSFDATNLLSGINPFIIHSIAIVLSLIAWYVSHSLGYRLRLVSEKYKFIVKSIGKEFGHNDASPFFKTSMARFQSASLFLTLIILNIYFIIHKLGIL